jgi:hypothetical protein
MYDHPPDRAKQAAPTRFSRALRPYRADPSRRRILREFTISGEESHGLRPLPSKPVCLIEKNGYFPLTRFVAPFRARSLLIDLSPDAVSRALAYTTMKTEEAT